MNKSESIASLASALAKAQGQIKGAKKDTANPFFKSKYADLASVVEAIQPHLSTNELSYIQLTIPSEKDEVQVETVLAHSSGEWISGIIAVPVSKSDAQGYGSALTYARRYGLSAIVGVAPEDDDGNAAAQAKPAKAGMPESQVADFLASIEGCDDIPSLQNAYTAAYKAAQAYDDKDAMASITKAKNARKTILALPAVA